ncbi:MAG: EAL domain-containing protein [Pseudomonadota bacterium]
MKDKAYGGLFRFYNRVTGWFLSPRALQYELNARRGRMSVVGAVLAIIVCLGLLTRLYIQQGEFTRPDLMVAGLMSLLICTLLLNRFAQSTIPLGAITAFAILAMLTLAGYTYGGAFSSTLHWFPLVPLFATFMGGRRLGILVAVFTAASALLLYFSEIYGYTSPHRMSSDELLRISPYLTVGAVLVAALVAETYEWVNDESRMVLMEEQRQRNQAERALDAQKEQSLVTLEAIADGVIATDESDRITYINPTATQLTGWPGDSALGHSLSEVFMLFDEQTHEPRGHFIQTCLDDGYAKPVRHHILLSYDGHETIVEHKASLIRGRKGEVKGVVVIFHDVTMERELTLQLRYQATHDPLSDLLNRHEFEHQLQQLVSQPNPDDHHVLCTLDINQFKVINDTCGHSAGDDLIRQFADMVRDEARPGDITGRLGGDEFGILFVNTSNDEALPRIQALRERVANYQFNWEDKSFAISAAIGVVEVDGNTDYLADLMNDADAARHTAKEKGRNRIHVFEPDDHELLRRRGEMRWAAYLNGAIAENRFLLTRQSIVPLNAEEQGEHYEILLRAIGENGQMTSAGDFLNAAERYNLISEIDRWVVKNVVDWFVSCPESMASTHTVSINLSARSIVDSRFNQDLRQQLMRLPGLASKVCFEITETAAIANFNQARQFIVSMRALGCRFALDDFGKGMSSLSYLKQLPVDYLKIDGDFVRDILNDPIDRSMVEHINQIAHLMGMKTIAEYAESEDIIATLRQIGIDYAQGFGIDKPHRFYCQTPEASQSNRTSHAG